MIDRKKLLLKTSFILLIVFFSLEWSFPMNNTTHNKDLFFHKLDSLDGVVIKAGNAEIKQHGGSSVLELNGMIIFPQQMHTDATIEVEIFAPAACYPGIAFRIDGDSGFELAYSVPHASNLPDALQYDPVFNGSNTWQLFNGPCYQKQGIIPTGKWFSLRIDIQGDRAAVHVDAQPPLIVEKLAHTPTQGAVGLWTFLPALFRNFRISTPNKIELTGKIPQAPEGAIMTWKLDDQKKLQCEPNGILNLNRYLPPAKEGVTVSHDFHLETPGKFSISAGFSDELILNIDGKEIFRGVNQFKGFKDIPSRGWVTQGENMLQIPLDAGDHKIEAQVKISEPLFGWGLIITINPL